MKTQKSFRKKALLSSVAMLLVSAVAVGSATFAWFTSSTTTTADGLNVKTSRASELVISKSGKDWKQEIHYGMDNKVLRPASSADGANWYSAEAAAKGAYDAIVPTSGDTFTKIADSDLASYVFKEELNVANKGSAAVKDVTITISGLSNAYARMALVEVTSEGAAVAGKTFAGSIFDSEGDTYDAVSGTDSTDVTSIKASNQLTVNVGQLAGKTGSAQLGGAKYYKLYVWFEGQDTDCYDTNAGQLIGDISISVSGATVEDTNS
ncbi:MAG: hypothetical protein ACI4I4_01355 [Acutalibacteraceae bacterium]